MRIVQSEISLGRKRPRPVYISKQTAVKRTAQRSFTLLDDRPWPLTHVAVNGVPRAVFELIWFTLKGEGTVFDAV